MKKEAAQFGVQPFSYDILDEEAKKISSLILAVNKKCAGAQVDDVARELFQWAEQMSKEGRVPEAEFLYLHAINIWQRHHVLNYPVLFVSLRDYAQQLLAASESQKEQLSNVNVTALVDSMPIIETNAA